ncbi:MAG: GtrA family protein [Leptonema sp. (in: Bacteria)]|nr:GtrA family protein [Leptonema sp. (in: bacteria)]
MAIIYGLTAIGVSYIISNGIGYTAGFVNSFLMNRFWTFRSRGQIGRQLFWFVLIFGISYLFQLAALLIQTNLIGVPIWLAQLISMAVYTAVNFVLNKIVTFRTT